MTSPVTTSTPSAASGCGVGGLPGQRPHGVAPLDQQLADVGAGQPGGSRDQDGLAHEAARTEGSSIAESTWSALYLITGSDCAEHVERVDEAVQAHRVRAGEPELDDLGRREVLAQPPVDLVVDGVVIGRQQVEELDGQALLLVELRPCPATPGRPRPPR